MHKLHLPHRSADDIKNRSRTLARIQEQRRVLAEQLAAAYSIPVEQLPFDPRGPKVIDFVQVCKWAYSRRRALLFEAVQVCSRLSALAAVQDTHTPPSREQCDRRAELLVQLHDTIVDKRYPFQNAARAKRAAPNATAATNDDDVDEVSKC